MLDVPSVVMLATVESGTNMFGFSSNDLENSEIASVSLPMSCNYPLTNGIELWSLSGVAASAIGVSAAQARGRDRVGPLQAADGYSGTSLGLWSMRLRSLGAPW